MMKIGLLSDTHGYLSPALWELFEGCQTILHAGDIGHEGILADLETIAPVRAVRGNTDSSLWNLPEDAKTEVDGLTVLIRHAVGTTNDKDMRLLGKAVGEGVVLFGHTHRPFIKQVKKTLFVNPGSASRSRAGYNSAGILETGNKRPKVTIHNLSDKELPVEMRWPEKPEKPEEPEKSEKSDRQEKPKRSGKTFLT